MGAFAIGRKFMKKFYKKNVIIVFVTLFSLL